MSVIPKLHFATIPSLRSNSVPFRAGHPFNITLVDQKRIGDTHWHDYTQLWYTVSGSYTQIINGEAVKQSEGSLSLIFPFTVHSVCTPDFDSETTRIICIDIYDDLFGKNIMPLRPISYVASAFDRFILTPYMVFSNKEREKADELFEHAYAEYSKKELMSKQSIYSDISNIFELAIKNTESLSARTLSRAYAQAEAISEVSRYIIGNMNNDISISHLAREFYMSTASINNKFKACTGQTPHTFHINARLTRVIQLLRFSNLTLTEIAQECGFYDGVHLSHIIKSVFGMSATQLRAHMLARSRNYGESNFDRMMRKYSWLNIWDEEDIEKMRLGATGVRFLQK